MQFHVSWYGQCVKRWGWCNFLWTCLNRLNKHKACVGSPKSNRSPGATQTIRRQNNMNMGTHDRSSNAGCMSVPCSRSVCQVGLDLRLCGHSKILVATSLNDDGQATSCSCPFHCHVVRHVRRSRRENGRRHGCAICYATVLKRNGNEDGHAGFGRSVLKSI